MHKLSPADELADIRVNIARLRRRELILATLLESSPATPFQRPGWPIQRDIGQTTHHA